MQIQTNMVKTCGVLNESTERQKSTGKQSSTKWLFNWPALSVARKLFQKKAHWDSYITSCDAALFKSKRKLHFSHTVLKCALSLLANV